MCHKKLTIMTMSAILSILVLGLCFCNNWLAVIFFGGVILALIFGVISIELQNWRNEKATHDCLKAQAKNAKRFSLND